MRGHRELVVFGWRAVREALALDPRDFEICEVWVAKSVSPKLREEIETACRQSKVDMRVGTPAPVHALSGEPRHDQGVAARVGLERVIDIASDLEAK